MEELLRDRGPPRSARRGAAKAGAGGRVMAGQVGAAAFKLQKAALRGRREKGAPAARRRTLLSASTKTTVRSASPPYTPTLLFSLGITALATRLTRNWASLVGWAAVPVE